MAWTLLGTTTGSGAGSTYTPGPGAGSTPLPGPPAQANQAADLMKQFQKQQRRANRANRRRYQEILDTLRQTQQQVGGRYDEAQQLVSNLGQSELGRIEQGRERGQAQAMQDLTSRGLGNTTILASANRGVDEDAARLRGELTERVGAQRAGLLTQRAGAEQQMGQFFAGMQERRTDQGPNAGLFAQLMSQFGAGAGGSQPQSIFTGLSANARAGLDAFGQPSKFNAAGTGTWQTGGAGLSPLNKTPSGPFITRGGSGGSPPVTGGGGGVGFSDFERMFIGQPVLGGGGTYGAGGQIL